MAVHDQFTNCTLESVTVEQYGIVSKATAEDTWTDVFRKLIGSRLPVDTPVSLFDAYETVKQLLDENE